MAKMWAGRTDGVTEKIADDFNSSIRFDSRMYQQDIKGSMVHAAMLAGKNIITQEDADTLIAGLEGILSDIDSGNLAVFHIWLNPDQNQIPILESRVHRITLAPKGEICVDVFRDICTSIIVLDCFCRVPAGNIPDDRNGVPGNRNINRIITKDGCVVYTENLGKLFQPFPGRVFLSGFPIANGWMRYPGEDSKLFLLKPGTDSQFSDTVHV
jgi:hypothetical protein